MFRFGQWYAKTYRHWPYTLAFATCFVKGSISDSITQKKLEKNTINSNQDNWLDYKRNARFATWSGAYCGSVQHFVYNVLYARLFPASSVLSKVCCTAFDGLIHVPFFYFPSYYLFKSLFLGGNGIDGLNEFWDNKWKILTTYWKIWTPIIFSVMFFVPFEFRVGTIGVASLFWLILLSYIAPMTDSDHDKDITHQNIENINKQKEL
eukprot:158975_1